MPDLINKLSFLFTGTGTPFSDGTMMYNDTKLGGNVIVVFYKNGTFEISIPGKLIIT